MKTFFIILITLSLLVGAYLLNFKKYQSAFEADQACHYDLSGLLIDEDGSKYGCDHDLETRQWLLFNKLDKIKSAIVLERYRY